MFEFPGFPASIAWFVLVRGSFPFRKLDTRGHRAVSVNYSSVSAFFLCFSLFHSIFLRIFGFLRIIAAKYEVTKQRSSHGKRECRGPRSRSGRATSRARVRRATEGGMFACGQERQTRKPARNAVGTANFRTFVMLVLGCLRRNLVEFRLEITALLLSQKMTRQKSNREFDAHVKHRNYQIVLSI